MVFPSTEYYSFIEEIQYRKQKYISTMLTD